MYPTSEWRKPRFRAPVALRARHAKPVISYDPWRQARGRLAKGAACALLAVCARSGFLGGYGAYAGAFAATLSTFSSLNFGLFSMLRGGRYFAAAAYFGLSVLTAAVAVWAC